MVASLMFLKKILLRGSCLVISYLLILIVMQFFIFKFTSIHKIALYTKLYDYARWVKSDHVKVLIMGSSHARYSISPKCITENSKQYKYDEIFNVGAGAASPFAMYITYKKNIHKFKKLELVYFALSPHMLSEKYFLYLVYEKIFLNFKQWNYFLKHHYTYLKKYHLPVNLFFFPIFVFINSCQFSRKIFSGRNNGFDPLKHQDFASTKPNTIKKYVFDPLDIFPVSSFQIQYIKKLKKLIENNGGKFIMFLTPTYTWHSFYKLEANEYDSALVFELNKNIGPVSIIGSLSSSKYDLDYSCFYDDTHLSEKGALRFTEAILKDIDRHKNLDVTHIKSLYEY